MLLVAAQLLQAEAVGLWLLGWWAGAHTGQLPWREPLLMCLQMDKYVVSEGEGSAVMEPS